MSILNQTITLTWQEVFELTNNAAGEYSGIVVGICIALFVLYWLFVYQLARAEGEAKAFDLINKSFVDNAQLLKKLEVTENSLKNNSKILLTEKGISPQLIIGDLPIKK